MTEADGYIAKWLARKPDLELALLFCPAPQRRLAALWGALTNELDASVFDLSDANVAQAKLAWWGEELGRGSNGEARHPLAREFFEQAATREIVPARWPALAHAGLRLVLDESSPADSIASVARMLGFARELAAIESSLFAVETPPAALAIERLLGLWPQGDAVPSRLRWPLQLRARHQVGANDCASDALRRDYASELAALLELSRGGWVLRRCITALALKRTRELAQGREAVAPQRWRTLWAIWRAARGA